MPTTYPSAANTAAGAGIVARMLQALTDWWDTLELWLAQRSFPLQFLLVMLVLMPVCLGLAWLIDRMVEYLFARLGARDADESPPRPSS